MIRNKYKILLVEDEANIRNLVATVLDTAGYQSVLAKSCAEAKNMFTSYWPDLVVLDLGLPDGDGMEFISFVRKTSTTKFFIILVSTNH